MESRLDGVRNIIPSLKLMLKDKFGSPAIFTEEILMSSVLSNLDNLFLLLDKTGVFKVVFGAIIDISSSLLNDVDLILNGASEPSTAAVEVMLISSVLSIFDNCLLLLLLVFKAGEVATIDISLELLPIRIGVFVESCVSTISSGELLNIHFTLSESFEDIDIEFGAS